MPKIIENLQETLLCEARRQVMENGYGAMTIRSIAAACGVGTGTVYNYFPSKEQLVAGFMLADWQECLLAMTQEADAAEKVEGALYALYMHLHSYIEKNGAVLRDAEAAAGFGASFGKYHALLRSQLASPLARFCPDDFTADFIAEAMLVWTVNGKSFEELYRIITKLI